MSSTSASTSPTGCRPWSAPEPSCWGLPASSAQRAERGGGGPSASRSDPCVTLRCAASFPRHRRRPHPPVATSAAPLTIDIVERRCAPGAPSAPRQVSRDANVFGDRPMPIASALVRARTPDVRRLLQGPWRELGPVTLLRSGWSMSAHELDVARGALDERVIDTPERLRAALERTVAVVDPKGRRVISRRRRPAGRGRRPLRRLCRQRRAVPRQALARGDQCAAGPGRARRGRPGRGRSPTTRRRWTTCNPVVDRVPIERVVFLADQRSDTAFLADRITAAWNAMADGSPNDDGLPRRRSIAVTDHMPHSHRRGAACRRRVPLRARRRQTRRVAALAHARARRDDVATQGPLSPVAPAERLDDLGAQPVGVDLDAGAHRGRDRDLGGSGPSPRPAWPAAARRARRGSSSRARRCRSWPCRAGRARCRSDRCGTRPCRP